MPEKLESTFQLLPKKLIVYRRSNSAAWQCRYKIGNRWFASSTKESDLNAAKDRAQKLLIEAEIRSAADIPVVTKRFRDVAKLTLQTMDVEESRGKVPVSYKDYRRIITDYIVELSRRESNHILAMLYEHLQRQEFTVRFRWEPGSIAFWDNRATAHIVPTDIPAGMHRCHERITLAGDIPVDVAGNKSYALVADE